MVAPSEHDDSRIAAETAHRPDLERIDGLASLLIEARSEGRPIDDVPADLVPVDAVEAQLVDDHVAARTGWPVLGWKIGCTSEHAQKLLGSPGPFAGRVYSVFDSGVRLSADQFCSEPYLEGELAFTLDDDLDPAGPGAAPPHSRQAVLAAVAAVRPAIEVVGGRYSTFIGAPLTLLIADAGVNTLLVIGDHVEGVDPDRLRSTGAEMQLDGTVVGSGSGADVLGDPVEALVWLANHLSARNIGLRAGQTVTTGTATQVAHLPVGARATAAFDGIGSVSVTRI